MAAVVSIKAVVSELDSLMDGAVGYFNRETGEFHIVFADDGMDVDGIDDEEAVPADLPEWQKEILLTRRDIATSKHWIELPSKFDIHDYAIMEDFCRTCPEARLRADLCDAIKGSGAFKRFESLIRRQGIEQRWYQFRENELTKMALEWLAENNIEFTRDS